MRPYLLVPRFASNRLWLAAREVPSWHIAPVRTGNVRDLVTGADLVTFSRASTATYENSQGIITTAGANELRLTPLGLFLEEQRINEVRNSSGGGAAVGSPGTMPTGWGGQANSNGWTREIAGTGTDSQNGLPYVDVRLYGTPTGSQFSITFLGQGIAAASNGQAWAASVYHKLVSGSMGDIVGYPGANLWNSAVSYVGGMSLPGTLIPVSSWSRYTGSGTIATANTAFISWGITFVCTAGTAYDFTIRFAAPQIELGSTVSSWIPNTSTSAAVTRSADVADLLSWALANNIRSAYIRGRTTASGTRGLLSGNNNSSSNRIEAITSGADPRLQVTTSGSSVADINGGTIAANTSFRMAMRFDTDSYALSINGGAVVSDTSGARPTIDRWFLGRTQAGEYGNCYLEELALFYSGLNDSRLTAMGGV